MESELYWPVGTYVKIKSNSYVKQQLGRYFEYYENDILIVEQGLRVYRSRGPDPGFTNSLKSFFTQIEPLTYEIID